MKKIHVSMLALVLLAGSVGLAQQAAPPTPRPAPSSRPAATAPARALAPATPESVGISSARLALLHKGMQAYVDRKEVGGIVTLIARDGKIVDVHATGFQDVEGR